MARVQTVAVRSAARPSGAPARPMCGIQPETSVPRNAEVKIPLAEHEFHRIEQTIRTFARHVADVRQEDYFFAVSAGRLKLRIQEPGPAELIAYQRPDTPETRVSEYHCYRSHTPELLKRTLLTCLPLRGIVRKRRTVYLVQRTRIHLDRVDGLGTFIELETAFSEDSPEAESEARAEVEQILRRLGLAQAPRVAAAYIDLMENACP